jgi:hypothetical protein
VISTLAALSAGGALAAGVSAAVQAAKASASAPSACTADPLRIDYSIQYSATLPGDAVTGVTVSDTASSPDLAHCAGAVYTVTLLDASGRSLGAVRGTVPATATAFSSRLPAPVVAARVAQARLTLGG